MDSDGYSTDSGVVELVPVLSEHSALAFDEWVPCTKFIPAWAVALTVIY